MAHAREFNRNAHAQPGTQTPEARSRRATGPQPAPGGNAAARQEPAAAGHETIGRAPAAADQRRLEQSRRAEQRRAPIIRNPVFANLGSKATAPSQWTFGGRFGHSAFHDEFRRHHRHGGIVLGFVGPLFWPYAYSDFVDYTFAPYAYDTFWPYAFDDVYAGIYGGYAPEYYAPEDAYAYAGSPGSERVYARAANAPSGGGSSSQVAGDTRICAGQAQGVTDFSIQKIADQVKPDQKQQELLDALKAASVQAVEMLQKACPSELPSTPTGRLAAMRARVDAMLKAVETVRPALDKFYASLSDEQRERFIAVDQGDQAGQAQRGADLNRLCEGDLAAKSGLPIEKIKRTLKLSSDQDDGLRALDQATVESAKMLEAKCQPDQSLTPTGRLAAMEDRLQAMSKALETTQAALSKFYGSLSDEQKAQFDRINARPS